MNADNKRSSEDAQASNPAHQLMQNIAQINDEVAADSDGTPTFEQQVLARLELIMDELEVSDNRLWSIEHIARFLNTSRSSAYRIMSQPGAPRPISVPTSKTTKLPDRYEPEEVRRYAIRHKRRRESRL